MNGLMPRSSIWQKNCPGEVAAFTESLIFICAFLLGRKSIELFHTFYIIYNWQTARIFDVGSKSMLRVVSCRFFTSVYHLEQCAREYHAEELKSEEFIIIIYNIEM